MGSRRKNHVVLNPSYLGDADKLVGYFDCEGGQALAQAAQGSG